MCFEAALSTALLVAVVAVAVVVAVALSLRRLAQSVLRAACNDQVLQTMM